MVDVVLSNKHCVLLGQQKSEGKSLPHGLRSALPPQVESCRLTNGVKSSGTQNDASPRSSSGIQSACEGKTFRRQMAIRDVVNMMKRRALEVARVSQRKVLGKVAKEDQAAQRPEGT